MHVTCTASNHSLMGQHLQTDIHTFYVIPENIVMYRCWFMLPGTVEMHNSSKILNRWGLPSARSMSTKERRKPLCSDVTADITWTRVLTDSMGCVKQKQRPANMPLRNTARKPESNKSMSRWKFWLMRASFVIYRLNTHNHSPQLNGWKLYLCW